jgi:hypothetical protein
MTEKKYNVFLVVCFTFGIATQLVQLHAENVEIKLNSNDGSTGFIIQSSTGNTVYRTDSNGNIIIKGTVTVQGAGFSVGNSSFVVKNGNVGIGTTDTTSKLTVFGTIEIKGTGGIKFPDATVQTTAANNSFIKIGILYGQDAADDGYPGNLLLAGKHKALVTGTITTIVHRIWQPVLNGKIKFAIYANDAVNGRPTGGPLAQTGDYVMLDNTTQGDKDSTILVPLITPLNITAGTIYWIAALSDSAYDPMTYMYRESQRTSMSQYWSRNYSDGFPTITTVGTAACAWAVAAF